MPNNIPPALANLAKQDASVRKFLNEINPKKYGLIYERNIEEVKENIDRSVLPILEQDETKSVLNNNGVDNILIEGDNYNALSILNYTHKNKIDVIYIDPPYNTGAKDWKYNNDYVDKEDSYKHSKWINMMYERLRLAKNLLKNNGVLICAIDENELYNLGLLIKELFINHQTHLVTIVHNPRGTQGKNFSYVNEFALFVIPKNQKVVYPLKNNINNEDENSSKPSNFRNWGGESERKDGKNCFYPILIKNNCIIGFEDVLNDDKHPNKRVEFDSKSGVYRIYPLDKNNNEKKWRYARQTVEAVQHRLSLTNNMEVFIASEPKTKTVWRDKKYDSSVHGTQLLGSIIGTGKFNYPKSLYLVKDCISTIIQNRKNAVVIDFFAGSGTTGHAVLDLNKEDNGNRKFILCTNNENKIATNVCQPRIKKVITGYKDSKGNQIEGLGSNLQYFKINNKVKPKNIDRRRIVRLIAEILCVKESCFDIETKRDCKYRIYFNRRNSKHFGIIYTYSAIEEYLKVLKEYKGIHPIPTYVFTQKGIIPPQLKTDPLIKPISVPDPLLNLWSRGFES